MKYYEIKRIGSLVVSFIFLLTGFAYSQDEASTDEKKDVLISLNYYKKSDNSKTLISKIKFRNEEKKIECIEEGKVLFYVVDDSTDVLLGEAVSNTKGEAVISLKKDFEFSKDSTGSSTFKAIYDGDDNYNEADAEVSIADLQIELSLDMVGDTAKVISVYVYTTTNSGEKIPLEETDLNIYVLGLFKPLMIEEGYLEGGKCSTVFPEDLPGDYSSVVTIAAKIEENELYGNVEQTESINWGSGEIKISTEHPTRILNAPLWVIIILYTALSIAILHSIYAIYALFLIAMKNKKLKTETL